MIDKAVDSKNYVFAGETFLRSDNKLGNDIGTRVNFLERYKFKIDLRKSFFLLKKWLVIVLGKKMCFGWKKMADQLLFCFCNLLTI